MYLTIDIGNTTINFGLFKGSRIFRQFIIPTKEYSLKKIKKVLIPLDVDNTIICSVVPAVSKVIEKDIKALTGKKPFVLGKNIFVPIKNLYHKPKQVGGDRLVNAYAGTILYGAPLIIIDFGTAVTFDIITKNKEYLGGMIFPGVEISLKALSQGTALLPKITLRAPGEFIARNTTDSMLSGIIHGFAALTDKLSEKIQGKIGKAKIIGTGGTVQLIGKFCKKIDKTDKNLTLKGLYLILKNQKISRP